MKILINLFFWTPLLVLAGGGGGSPTKINLDDIDPTGGVTIPILLCRIAEAIFTATVIAAVIAFLAASFLYLTSGGSEQKTKKAKDALVYVIYGLGGAFLSWGAAFIVASTLTGGAEPSLFVCP